MRGLTKAGLLAGAVFQALVLGYFFSAKASAAPSISSGTNLTTSPVSVDLSTQPGKIVTTVLRVQNNSKASETIAVRLEKFKAGGLNGQAAIYAPLSSDPSIGWVHFSQDSFEAEPGVWNSITMTINVPTYATLGYYYAVLFTPQNAVNALNKGTNTIKSSNAVLVLLDTNSKSEQKQLKVTSFTSAKRLYQFLPATFSVTIINSGNIHLIPEGDIYISRAKDGKTIDSIEFNSGQGNVLPDSSRVFEAQWSDGFPVFQAKKNNGQIVMNAKGQPVEQLEWNFSSSFSKIRFGKYYAHLALVYSNGNRDVSVDSFVSFWVIPWKFMTICLLVIVALIVLWKYIKKLLKKIWYKVRKKSIT